MACKAMGTSLTTWSRSVIRKGLVVWEVVGQCCGASTLNDTLVLHLCTVPQMLLWHARPCFDDVWVYSAMLFPSLYLECGCLMSKLLESASAVKKYEFCAVSRHAFLPCKLCARVAGDRLIHDYLVQGFLLRLDTGSSHGVSHICKAASSKATHSCSL